MRARDLFFLILIVGGSTCTTQAADGLHDKDFWRAVYKDEGKVPGGLQPHDLAPELIDDLASTDPEMRDVLAYNVLVLWIYKGVLTPDEVRPLMATLLGNLRAGIGESGTDGVFRRSYSALILSVIAARHIDQPFLTADEYRTLLDRALEYLAAEKDERGYDPTKGWMHSVAHTADLLKFLARDPRLAPPEQERILMVIFEKVEGAQEVYSHGEDERLGRVVIALARRDPPAKDVLAAWVKGVVPVAMFPESPTPENLRRAPNVRHLLTSLSAEMSLDERPSAGLDALRADVRAALKEIL